MLSEKQYLDLYQSSSRIIKKNSAEVLNAVRDAAYEDFRRLGFPSRKVERYKYTDMSAIFEPDYGLNLNRLEIPVDPYEAFRCDVPNLSTSLYFVVNDAFYNKALPKVELPGHSSGSVTFYCEAEHVAFTGDTLFHNSIGRTDFPGGSMFRIINSLRHLGQLPDETQVLPGHGEYTSIGEELAHNPYMDR